MASSTLFRQTCNQMLLEHPGEFEQFRKYHDLFRQDQTKWKSDFDHTGKIALKIIEETENRLCSKMENSNRGKYSSHLSDKFRDYLRTIFPLIDLVGVTIS